MSSDFIFISTVITDLLSSVLVLSTEEKKYPQPKSWELCFIQWEYLGLQAPGDSISSNPERTALRRWGKESGYIEVLQQRAGSPNIKRLLLIKENQISQVKEFCVFLGMERWKSLGSLKSFLSYACQLSWASILWSHMSWTSLRLIVGSGCSPDGR